MIRIHPRLVAAFSVLILPSISLAQVQVSPGLQDAPKAEVKPFKELRIQAAASPDPLLRYRLWPEPELRKAENAAPLVSRAVILELQVSAETQKQFNERFQEWNEMSIDELPIDEVRALVGKYGAALGELQRSQNLMRTDYSLQLEELTAAELIQTLLPELQEMRTLARVLSLRARLAIREQRWDDLVDDCRVGFRLAEVAGHSTDFLVGRLVGFAIANTMMEVIEQAIQQPGCPNLYWALASLPSARLFETRNSLEFESILISRVFADVGRLTDEPIGPIAAREKFRSIVDQANRTLLNTGKGGAEMLGGAYVVVMADPSRDLLANTTQWGQRAYSLSASEAVLRATALRFARARDRWVAWSMLPPEIWDEYESEWNDSMSENPAETDVVITMIGSMTPAVNAARQAGRRSEQFLNWLITIEALRMHAAQTGELPVSIDHLLPVPAWRDTMAKAAFGYQRSAPDQATLTRAPRYPDDPDTTYRITLKGTK